jgi:glycosyltransferase involved in cell wall biosynthesis
MGYVVLAGERGGGSRRQMARIFLVVGVFGDGGITKSMANRARLFTDAGHECAIVSLDFRSGHEQRVAALREAGRLPRTIAVLNPYVALRDRASSLGLPPETAVNSLPIFTEPGRDEFFATATESTDEGQYFRYFGPSGDLIREDVVAADGTRTSTVSDPKTIHSWTYEYSDEGWIERISVSLAGVEMDTKYLTRSGHVFLTRPRVEFGKARRPVYRLDHERGDVEIFPTTAAWQSQWLTSLLGDDEERGVIICDGPAAVRGVAGVSPRRAIRILAVHGNHRWQKERYWFVGEPVSSEALVVLTHRQADDIEEDYGHNSKLHVIPNVIPNADVPLVDRDALRVSMFGRLDARKGTHDAVSAWAKVVERFPTAELHIFGEGSEKEALALQIGKLSLQRSVFLRGYSDDPSVEMARSAVVLSASRTEGFGLTIAEAMLNETPVVAFDCRYGPKELISPNRDGLLVPEGDIDPLAKGVVRLLRRPERARSMGQQARVKITSMFTEEPVLALWEALIASL